MRKTKIFTSMFLLALLTLGADSLHSAYAINVKLNKKEKRTISGVVLDENKLPMIGVNVWVKETSIGTATDADGRFTLKLAPGQNVIVTSFIGYAKQEIILNGKTKVKIQLKLDDKSLDEVVVVGFGSQKKESVIGAITTIKPDRLKSGGGSMISNTLAGQTSGLVVVRRSGHPGSHSEFYIRGINTFSGNTKPLVLVDGIERSLDLVNPDDIESFSILKDATATAVYGVRGANGVIIIKTKKGQIGRPTIRLHAEKGFQFLGKLPKMVNSMQWAELYNEATGTNNKYTDEIIEKYRTNADPDLYPNVNWFNELYKNNYGSHNVSLNVTGGGSLARYYLSASYYHEGSIYKDDNSNNYDASQKYNKFHFRGNLDVNLTPTTRLYVNFSNIYQDKTEPGAGVGAVWNRVFMTSPNAIPKKYSNGQLASARSDNFKNPYNVLMHTGYSKQYWVNSQSLLVLYQDFSSLITPGLSAKLKYSWDAKNENRIKRSKTPPQVFATGRGAKGNLIVIQHIPGQKYLGYNKANNGNRKSYFEASLTYNRTFKDKHTVGLFFLFNQDEFNNLNANKVLQSLPYRNQGLAARVTYAYSNRYFTEVNAGYNGSENFSPRKRFGLFPSIAAGWLISNERFFEPLRNIVDMVKLKGSYGIVGSKDIGGNRRFIYEPTINVDSSGASYGEKGNKGGGGVSVGEIGNTNVSWEQAAKLNLGLEISFFKRLKMTINYFNNYRTGIFMKRKSLPGIVGLSSIPWTNVGEMKNQGIDASLNFMYKIGDVYLTARGTFSFARNEVINDDLPPWKYDYQNRVGKPYGTWFVLKAIKLFESQNEIDSSPKQTYGPVRVGDLKYQDVNKDGKIDDNDRIAMKYNWLPEINYGFGLTAEYKGFNLSMLFYGVAHTSFFIGNRSIYGFSSTSIEQEPINLDVYNNRWHKGNPDSYAKYPRMTFGINSNNDQKSTWRLKNGSFMRLKNVELGYNFPKKWINGTFISGIRLYVSGQNLLRFSKFKLWDPELHVPDGKRYPFNKSIIVGLNLKI